MKLNLTIGWLYPQLMNIYGDRGNVLVLQKRCQWRNIDTKIQYLDLGFDHKKLQSCNLILMGGAQDRQQQAVSEDLFRAKKVLKNLIEKGVPGLYVCGAYQFLGNYYMEANGNKIGGLGIFDLYTKSPGDRKKRLIGNAAFKSTDLDYTLIGFENHGGRTYLGENIKPFGKVLKGFGNNAKDFLEGANYKNSFGTYLHGPLLPKNPVFADFLIQKALEVKYKKTIVLEKLDDTLEENSRIEIAKRLQIAI
ncbi:MAG: CobB/CobQ domain protein glutamine amidotransferase [Candidatus Levybacteria bacterium GW2011_GWB1_35_5]|nr:MAG: CobB/CobQ domain protein glutamine amidotransferase [Candidatus Levybacteria bacterium GW2011_GWB1_35_5]